MNRLNKIVAVAFAIAILTTGYANADTPPPAEQETTMPVLGFSTLERVDGSNGGDVQLSLFTFPEDIGDIVGFKADLFVQRFNANGLGVYGNVPLSAIVADGDNAAGIGNPEVGAAYARRRGRAGFVLRGGLALPLASSSNDTMLANMVGSLSRVGDIALAAPEIAWFRTSASGLIYGDRFIARVDIGVDTPLRGNVPRLTHVGFGLATGHPNNHTATWQFELAVANGFFGESVATAAVGVALTNGVSLSVSGPINNDSFGKIVIFTVGFNSAGSPPKSSLSSSFVGSSAPGETASVCETWKKKLAAATTDSEKLALAKNRPSECSN